MVRLVSRKEMNIPKLNHRYNTDKKPVPPEKIFQINIPLLFLLIKPPGGGGSRILFEIASFWLSFCPILNHNIFHVTKRFTSCAEKGSDTI
jgi:hypothetical protein